MTITKEPGYEYRRFSNEQIETAGLKGEAAIRRYLETRPGWEVVGYDPYACQWVTRRKKR